MKKAFAALALAAALLAGCRQPSAPSVEGRVTGTTIHSVILSVPGETETFVTISTEGTDPMLVPGVLRGDGVRVYYELLPDGETMHALQLEITEPSPYRLLPGIWRDCSGEEELGLVLAEDGSARDSVWPEKLQVWALDLDEDLLILSGEDPDEPKYDRHQLFKVEKLDTDSLVVVSEGGRRFHFSRQI